MSSAIVGPTFCELIISYSKPVVANPSDNFDSTISSVVISLLQS